MLHLKWLNASHSQLLSFNNTEILFSYETAVAAKVSTPNNIIKYRTTKHYSSVTSRHINSYIGGDGGDFNATDVEPEFFESLLGKGMVIRF